MSAMILRVTASAAMLAAFVAAPALAEGAPSLRGDVVATRDVMTLGELVENAPASLAETPVFRTPPLGQTGTIQVARITGAAETLGLAGIETGGRLQIVVTRAARRVGPVEIETALKRTLQAQAGLDPNATGVTFDGTAPSLVLAPDMAGDVVAGDLVVDRRSRRLSATVWIGRSSSERVASLRVTGSLVDMVEVAVTTRSLDRGETVKASDVALELRPRDLMPADAVLDQKPMTGRVTRRPLVAGTLVRPGDLARPEIVARGDIVTALYEAPGISLAMRLKAQEAGALGDTVSVVNPTSKKVLQAVVTGPGRVTVGSDRPDAVNTRASADRTSSVTSLAQR